MSDTYTWYCQWCIDHGRKPPTREWWDMACNPAPIMPANHYLATYSEVEKQLDADQREIDRERREGWAYD